MRDRQGPVDHGYLHREVATAAREQGLPLAADASRAGDELPAGSAGA
jgi:hypothetical protein